MNTPLGLVLQKPDKKDYIMGADRSIGGDPVLEERNWLPFVPTYETQKKRFFDDYGCVSHSKQNAIETLLYKLMQEQGKYGFVSQALQELDVLDENGRPDFSDRFTVVMSGTTPWVGNSPRNVAESLRKDGVVSEKDYPFLENMRQNEYYKHVPEELIEKARKFYKYFEIKWEWVGSSLSPRGVKSAELYDAIAYAPITVCVDTRSPMRNGFIQNKNGGNFYNHQELLISAKKGKSWTTYNTYRRKFKHYHWSYRFAYDIRMSIIPKLDNTYVSRFLKTNQGVLVKGSGPAIYLIKGKKKRPFISWLDYIMYTGGHVLHETVDNTLLGMVEEGKKVERTESPHYDILKKYTKDIAKMDNRSKIEFVQQIIAKESDIVGHQQEEQLSFFDKIKQLFN